jgi:uracil-DNA glycosylase family 4
MAETFKCPCETIKYNFVGPEGSDDPDYYFLGEAPGFEESLHHRVFIGEAGKILRRAISELRIISYRIYNAVSCRPTRGKSNRTPTSKEIKNCSNLCRSDIQKHRPKKLILLGASAVVAIFPEFEGSRIKDLVDRKFEWEGIETYVCYHPSYILRGNSYENDFIAHLKKYISGDVKPVEEAKFPTQVLYPRDMYRLEEIFRGKTILGYDLESNGYPPMSEKFRVIGIGIENIYIPIETLELDLYEEFEENKHYLVDFLKDKTLEVFNMGFEHPVTLSSFGVEPKYKDVMILCRTMNIFGDLKTISRIKLNISDWSTVVVGINKLVVSLRDCLINRGKQTPEYAAFKENGFGGMVAYIKEVKKKLTKRQLTLLTCEEQLSKIFEDYPEHLKRIEEKMILTIQNGKTTETMFEFVPLSIISEYCVIDACVAPMLFDVLTQEAVDGELDAFNVFEKHMDLGCDIQVNAIAWDDTLAEELKGIYVEQRLQSLKSFLSNPLFVQGAELTLDDEIKIQTTTDISELKKYFNPASSVTFKELFNKVIMTKDMRLGLLLYFVDQELARGNDGECQNCHRLMPLTGICKVCGNRRHRSVSEAYPNITKFLKGKYDNLKHRFEVFKSKFLPETAGILTYSENAVITKCHDWKCESFDAEVIRIFYEVLTRFIGVNIEDPATWNDEMRLLWNFKKYKKVEKNLSTYIEGKNGRGQVFAVEKDRYLSDPTAIRYEYGSPYPDGSMYILQPEYNVIGAATRRWMSFIHTIPSTSELKDMHISRYGDEGLLLHFDGSQQELRCLAVLAGETVLLEKFKAGEDVHTWTASLIFNKGLDTVTPEERQIAKSANFGIVYLQSEEAFAEMYLQGDVAKAREIFRALFSIVFAKIKEFREMMYKIVERDHKVKTLVGDTIIIDFDPEDKVKVQEAHRHACNYVVQSIASHIMGYGISNLSKFIKMKKWDSRIMGFTHDAGDADTKVEHLIDIIRACMVFIENDIDTTWGIPVKLDYGIGVSGRQLMKLEVESVTPDTLTAKFSCESAAIPNIVKVLEKHHIVELNVKGKETSRVKNEELFMPKRAYTMYVGEDREKVKGTIKIIRSDTWLEKW